MFPKNLSLGLNLCNLFVILAVLLNTQIIFLSAVTIKIAHSIRSATDHTHIPSDIDTICVWCATNHMNLDADGTRVITFTSTMSTTCSRYQTLGLIPALTYASTTDGSFLLYYTVVSPK